jgi:hypothetical protein
MEWEIVGTLAGSFILSSEYNYIFPEVIGTIEVSFIPSFEHYYIFPELIGTLKTSFHPNSICSYSINQIVVRLWANFICSYSINSYPNLIIAQSNIVLKLKLTSAEEDTKGKLKVSFVLQAIVERAGVVAPIESSIILNLSADPYSCSIKTLLGNTSYSPRICSPIGIPIQFPLKSFVFISNKNLVEFYESNEFINDTPFSGGIISINQLASINDNTVLPNFEYVSKNYPFIGYTRPRKIFAKNVSGYKLRYMHIGIEYPLIELNDINLVTIGTDIDVYGSGKWGYTSTGIIEDNIPIGFLTDSTTLEITYKSYASLVIWAGQLVKLSNGSGNSIFCVVSNVTYVDGQTVLVKLNSLSEITIPFIGKETMLIGLRSVSNVEIDESVPIWLLNIIPFNSKEVVNQRIRLFVQGVL